MDGHEIFINTINDWNVPELKAHIWCSCGWTYQLRLRSNEEGNRLAARAVGLKHISNMKEGRLI